MKNGYTLLEFLITLALLGIFLGLAVPSWCSMIMHNQTTAHVNQIVSAIQLARSEAIKRNMIVTLCKSADQKTCSGNWPDGQIVFIDREGRGQVQTPDDIIRVFDRLTPHATLQWKGSRGSQDYLQITPYGGLEVQNGTFLYCSTDQRYVRKISISPTGRVKIDTSLTCQYTI